MRVYGNLERLRTLLHGGAPRCGWMGVDGGIGPIVSACTPLRPRLPQDCGSERAQCRSGLAARALGRGVDGVPWCARGPAAPEAPFREGGAQSGAGVDNLGAPPLPLPPQAPRAVGVTARGKPCSTQCDGGGCVRDWPALQPPPPRIPPPLRRRGREGPTLGEWDVVTYPMLMYPCCKQTSRCPLGKNVRYPHQASSGFRAMRHGIARRH